jgi:hypothetical protein
MSETMPDAPATIEPMETPAASEGSMRDTMAGILAKYPGRGDDGQFESQRVEPDAPATETTDQPEATAAPEPATPVIEAPASWSAEKKAIWAAVPPEARDYILQREAEAHKAISEKGARAKLADDFEAAIGVHKTALVSEYGSLDRAVNTLVNVAMQAGADPAAFIRWFSQQHRLDLAQIAGVQAQPGQQQPQNTAVDQRIATLEQHIEQQMMAGMTSTIRAFAEAKDASGKPMRPHFEAVREEMGRLMQAGLAGTLDQAYAKAIRTNDAVWATVQAEEAATNAAKAKAEHERAAKAAADAKRASSVNVKPVGSASGSPVKGATMRDTMAAIARQHFSGNG